MATTTLVGANAGEIEQLLVVLEHDGLPIATALWRYPTAAADGRLIIASPEVDRVGSLPVYQRVQLALQRLPDAHLWLGDITAVGMSDPLVAKLRSSIPLDVPASHFGSRISVPDYASESGAPVTVQVLRWAEPEQPKDRNPQHT